MTKSELAAALFAAIEASGQTGSTLMWMDDEGKGEVLLSGYFDLERAAQLFLAATQLRKALAWLFVNTSGDFYKLGEKVMFFEGLPHQPPTVEVPAEIATVLWEMSEASATTLT